MKITQAACENNRLNYYKLSYDEKEKKETVYYLPEIKYDIEI